MASRSCLSHGLSLGRRAGGAHVVAQFGFRLAETPRSGQFLQQPHPPQSQQQHVVGAVGQPAMGGDPPQTGDRIERRAGPRSPFPSPAPAPPWRSARRRPTHLPTGRDTAARRCATAASRAETAPDSAAETAAPFPGTLSGETADRRMPTCQISFRIDYRQPVGQRPILSGTGRATLPCSCRPEPGRSALRHVSRMLTRPLLDSRRAAGPELRFSGEVRP